MTEHLLLGSTLYLTPWHFWFHVSLNSWNTFKRDICVLWFNFILCSKLIIIHYHSQKQNKRKFAPRIKLSHNIYFWKHVQDTSIAITDRKKAKRRNPCFTCRVTSMRRESYKTVVIMCWWLLWEQQHGHYAPLCWWCGMFSHSNYQRDLHFYDWLTLNCLKWCLISNFYGIREKQQMERFMAFKFPAHRHFGFLWRAMAVPIVSYKRSSASRQ